MATHIQVSAGYRIAKNLKDSGYILNQILYQAIQHGSFGYLKKVELHFMIMHPVL